MPMCTQNTSAKLPTVLVCKRHARAEVGYYLAKTSTEGQLLDYDGLELH